ncbi:MAG: hypothetical protein F4139_07495 [Gemmatimonadetes bacterium]|nr:hypothetical protein [Gemmatimonadota bacterium]MYH52782.1 hypothetical protein [Gemmatimonadota bacterium]MYK66098.1 hypothetical protein [Gemmatimonadota bacterium]
MNTTASPIRSGLDFLRHVSFWVLVPVAIYVLYVLVDATLWPDRDHLPQLVARLPFVFGQMLPVAVFAATSGRSGLFGGFDRSGRPHLWIVVALLAGVAYALIALVDPLLAPFTGSDALFPPGLDQALEVARDAARNTTGPESEAYWREAGGHLVQLVAPFATAAFVLVGAALGSFVGIAVRELPPVRCLGGGIFSGCCWGPLPIAETLAANIDLSAAGLFALILAIHLALPLLIAAVAAAMNWWSDR